MVGGFYRVWKVLVGLFGIPGVVVGCSEDTPCEDAAIVQIEPSDDGHTFASCRVVLLPGEPTDAMPGDRLAYDFTAPPVFTQDPWSCPELDVVRPTKTRHDCVTNFGPKPTSCFMDGGCFSLLFWGEAATDLEKLLGTDKYNTRLDCDGLIVNEIRYDPKGSAVIYCRDPELGGVDRKAD